jgi:hypothetical protein
VTPADYITLVALAITGGVALVFIGLYAASELTPRPRHGRRRR